MEQFDLFGAPLSAPRHISRAERRAVTPSLATVPKPVIKLRPYQEQAVDAVLSAPTRGAQRPLVVMPTGCHRAGTEILIADGTVKRVEDVIVGDKLVGPDGDTREVLQLARGRGEMVEIRPVKGEPFVVNMDHILTLQETSSDDSGAVVDVSVREYIGWSRNQKHLFKLFRSPASFSPVSLPAVITPYELGMILGDGSLSVDGRIGVTKPDAEIADACAEMAHRLGLFVRVETSNSTRCPTYLIQQNQPGNRGGYHWGGNALVNELRRLGLMPIACADRFIPHEYKAASQSARQQLLAGLLDTDGAVSRAGFDYGTKSRQLANDVAFVARSLGFAAYISQRKNGPGAGQYRVALSGDLSHLPLRIERKRAPHRRQIKSVLRTGLAVVPTGTVEDYYGFSLSGDGRFLLGDFTVTHNTGKTIVFSEIARRRLPGRTLILAHRDELLRQAADKFSMVTPGIPVGIVKAEENGVQAPVVIGSVQTLINRKRMAALLAAGPIETVIIDEAHHTVASSYRTILEALGSFDAGGPLTVGVTATPDRGDKIGLGNIFDEVAYELKLLDAIKAGYLCDIRATSIRIPVDFAKIRTTAGDYNMGDVDKQFDEAHAEEIVAGEIARHITDRSRILAFTPTVESAYRLSDAFERVGLSADAVDGTLSRDERRARLQAFADGRTNVLSSCALLTEGFDEPATDCVLLMRPTKSRSLYAQMIGRGLRTYPGKPDCLVVDVVGRTKELKLQTITDLTGLPLGEPKPAPNDAPKALNGASGSGSDANGSESILELLRAYGSIVDGDGYSVAEAVDLFGNSWATWLPIDGRWALPAGDSTYVLTAIGEGLWNVIRTSPRSSPEIVARGLDLGYAQGVAEQRAEAAAKTLADRSAFWRGEDVTTGQHWKLKDLGLDPRQYRTKGEASDAISIALTVRSLGALGGR